MLSVRSDASRNSGAPLPQLALVDQASASTPQTPGVFNVHTAPEPWRREVKLEPKFTESSYQSSERYSAVLST